MEIPSLPTDNLYKFMALSGILIGLFFTSILGYLIFTIEIKYIEINKQKDLSNVTYKVNLENRKNEKEYLDELENLIEEKKNYLKDRYNNQRTNEYYDDYRELIGEKREFINLKYKEKLKNNDNTHILELKKQEDSNRIEELIKILKFSIFLSVICVIGIIIGIFLAIKGFKLWQIKLQNYLDKNIEKKIN